MTAVPRANYRHVFNTARDVLEDADPRPFVRSEGRWIKITVHDRVSDDVLDSLADELRADGYHVSQMGPTTKATKSEVQWPDPDDS